MTMPEVTWSLDELPGGSVARAVTIGKFDGVHLGHQRVLQSLAEMAEDAELTVVTFDRHPRATLDPESAPEALVSIRQKVEFLGAAGVDRVAVIPFTHELLT
jgi:cytidyltransferase-related domain